MSEIEEGEVFEVAANTKIKGEPRSPVLPQKRRAKKAEVGREDRPYKKLPCKYFIGGCCFKGEECTFSHDVPKNLKTELCKYFLTNCCVKGQDCVYSHDTKKFPCKYLHGTGFCQSGNECRFSHVRLSSDQIPKFIRENDQFLQEVYTTTGRTNLGEFYLNYLKEKTSANPLLYTLPQPMAFIPRNPMFPFFPSPKPPSPDLNTRMKEVGLIKHVEIAPVDFKKFRKTEEVRKRQFT
jgi:hypothetical protein